MKKHTIILLIFLLNSFINFCQFGISGGTTFLKPFGAESIYPGFHLMGELNNDDVTTLYARLSFLPSKKNKSEIDIYALDINNPEYSKKINSEEKFNFTTVEFGKRYYFGEGFESGFGVYGGSFLSLNFNKIKYRTDSFDTTSYYSTVPNNNQTGSIVGLGMGLNGGIKNSFQFGTLYFDIGLNYALLAIKSPNLSTIPNNYSSLLFSFNLGYRKNLY